MLFAWITDPNAWLALGTLTLLEIVLGIDNIIFLSLVVAKLPTAQRAHARRLGLAGAMVMRLALLASIAWVTRLTNPLFTIFSQEISARDLILLLGGLFLIWKASKEIHESIEGEEEGLKTRVSSFLGAIVQIMLLATFEQLESARQFLGIDSLNMVKLVQVEALRPYLGEHLPLHGTDMRLEQLDELAENIRQMDQEDGALLKYLSVLDVEQPATLQEALKLSIELDDYERVPDDPEEYGKQVLERIGADEELISTLDGFADFEALGNFYMQEDGVRRTEFGLIRRFSAPFPEVQEGLQMH